MAAVIDLSALPDKGLVVPGIAAWLGYPPVEDEPDSYEAYLERLSETPL